MKKLILLSTFCCLLILGIIVLQSKKQDNAPKTISQAELFKHKKGARKAADFWQRKRQNQITKTVDLKDVYKARQKTHEKRTAKVGDDMSWEFMGPNNVGGRTRALLIDKDNSNRLYAGGVAGGIWLSDDKGNNWREHPQNETLECLAMSCVTQDKDGNIYFGTGEGFYFFAGEGSAGIPGEGIYKSSDNGETFELLAATRPSNPNNANDSWAAIHALDAHPTQDIVYAGTPNGLYLTQDGGETWTKPISSNGDGYDISIGSNGVVHTIVGTRYYRSTNGLDFEDLSGTNPGDYPSVGGRKRIQVAPSNPDYVYVVAVLNGSGCLKWVLQSKDGGDTWIEIGAGGSDFLTPMGLGSCQGNYNLAFGVDAVQEDRIFLGGLQFWSWKETGGWQQLDAGWWQDDPANLYFIHADKHDVVVDVNDPNTMYVISDGGITRSDNAQDDHPQFSTRNKNYNVTQFYGVGAGLDGKVIGGTQDNGTQFVGFGSNSAFTADEVSGGDGGNAEISDINPNVMFAGIYYGNLFRSGTGGESFSGYFDERIDSDGDGNIDGSAEFVTPFVLWEDLFSYILTGTEYGKIVTGSSNGNVWMTNEALALSTTPRWYNIGSFSAPYVVSCLAVSSDGNTVYAGTSGGQILRITNLNIADLEELHDDVVDGNPVEGAEITQITLPGANGQYINNIYTSNYGNRVYVALGNYGNDVNIMMSDNALVEGETDFRNSFVSIQNDLPEMPVYDLIEVHGNESAVVAGTELGVWLGQREGDTFTWTPQNNGLGNVPVFRVRQEPFGQEVDIATPDCQIIYIATHGKGLYRSTSFTYSTCDTDIDAGFLGENETQNLIANVGLNLYPNPASEQVTISFDVKKAIPTANIMLFDLQGRLMLEQKADALAIGKHTTTLNISNIAKGNYVIVLMTEKGKVSKKLTIQ
ncbi:MAG: T9SS type A sorting domain-containing protein [Chitinophagales bacterium]